MFTPITSKSISILAKHPSSQQSRLFAFTVRCAGNFAAFTVTNSKMQSCDIFGYKLDSNHWHANKVFWRTVRRLRNKRSNIAEHIWDQNGVLLSNDGTSLADEESISTIVWIHPEMLKPWIEVFIGWLVCVTCPGVLDGHRKIGKLRWSYHTHDRRECRNHGGNSLFTLGEFYVKWIEKRCRERIELTQEETQVSPRS